MRYTLIMAMNIECNKRQEKSDSQDETQVFDLSLL
jgi:hypothetical protein